MWCAMCHSCLIDPYFFENEMLLNFSFPEMRQLGHIGMCMLRDGETSHTGRLPMTTLLHQFLGRLISRFGDINWLQKSPDLNPLDYLPVEISEGKVLCNKTANYQTIDDLKENIRTEAPAIPPEVLHRMTART